MDEQAFFAQARAIRLEAAEAAVLGASIRDFLRAHPVRAASSTCPTDAMHKHEELFVGSAQTLGLSPEETRAMRRNLATFMEEHPPKASFLETLRGFLFLRPALAALVLLFGGWSVGYAAEYAVPGDTLYPVKVHVNERLRAAFAFSEESQAKTSAAIAEERLREAEELAAHGSLDENVRKQLVENFDRQTEQARRMIGRVGSRNAEAAAELDISLENMIEAHRLALEHLGEGRIIRAAKTQDSGMEAASRRQRERREEERGTMTGNREEATGGGGASSAASSAGTEDDENNDEQRPMELFALAERAIAAAEKKIASAPRALAPGEAGASGQVPPSAASQKMDDAVKLLAEARSALLRGDPAHALARARKAEAFAAQATVLLGIEQKLRMRVPAEPDGKEQTKEKEAENEEEKNENGSSSSSASLEIPPEIDARSRERARGLLHFDR